MEFPNFFKKTNATTATTTQTPTAGTATTPTAKGSKETYQQWGTRWAGQTSASETALDASFTVVVCQLKKEQDENGKLQQQLQQQTQTDIDNKKNTLALEEQKLDAQKDKLSQCEDTIKELLTEKGEIKVTCAGKQNKMAKANLWIGSIILACITIYLVLFYSSALYSAFFKTFDSDTEIYEALFDAQAWSKAYSQGVPAFLLISFLPFVFMGLGFIIHQFSTRNHGFGKYAKTFVLYCTTFVFDALLAYEISEKIYTLNKGLLDPPYSVSLASQNPRFWTIIFCGFIAYIIWGLMFDLTMQAYEELDEQKMKLKTIEEKIADAKAAKDKINDLIQQIQQNITTIKNDLIGLQKRLMTGTQYDYNAIKQELANFFGGWVAYMKLMAKPSSEVLSAQNIYNSFVSSFDKTIQQ